MVNTDPVVTIDGGPTQGMAELWRAGKAERLESFGR